MKFNGQGHFRGMHGLSEEPDHKILARARLKGLNIHPAVLDAVNSPAVRTSVKTGRLRCTQKHLN